MRSYFLYRDYKETEDGKLVHMTPEEIEERRRQREERLGEGGPLHLDRAEWIPVAFVIGFLIGFWLG